MKNNSTLLFILITLFCTSASFAQIGFIKIGDIKGESTERNHKDWIIVETFNQGLEQPVLETGVSRRRAVTVFNDLIITKKIDQATPKLMEMCSNGKIVPKLELDIVTSSGKVFYKVTLNNAKINSISTTSICDTGSDCKFMDKVAISYSKITWEYTNNAGRKVLTSAQTGI